MSKKLRKKSAGTTTRKAKKMKLSPASKKAAAAAVKAPSILDLIEAKIKKGYGDEAVLRLTDGAVAQVPVAFSSGIPDLDDAIGIGGYPANRVIEIFGPESSGKTTFALHAIAECQKVGGSAVFVDAEHALDIHYARNVGVDVDKLLISQPDSGEQALQIVSDCIEMKKLTPGNKPLVIVVDSVAALTPKSEIEGDIGDSKGVGEQARMMSKALRKLNMIMSKSNTVLIFINQTRDRINFSFGGGKTTTGGNALKFYCSVRISVTRTGSDKEGDDKVSNKTKVEIKKNKVAPPFKTFECSIRFGEGVDVLKSKYDKLCGLKNVEKPPKGAWVTLPDGRKFCGYKGFRELYQEDNKYIDSLLKAG